MVKMVVRDAKREPEQVIEWWLERTDSDSVILKCRSTNERGDDYVWGDGWHVATITDGGMYLHRYIGQAGLALTSEQRLKVIDK